MNYLRSVFLFSITIFFLIALISCKKNVKNNKVDKVTIKDSILITKMIFTEVEPSVPRNFDFDTFATIEVYSDTVFLKEGVYKKGKLENSLILNKIGISLIERDFFDKVPKEYLESNHEFGFCDGANDAGHLSVDIEFQNNMKIYICIGEGADEKHPIVKSFSSFYENSLEELIKK